MTGVGDGQLIEVLSADGTRLGVERLGDGPALLAVHGGTADRSRWAPIAGTLSEHFTLYLLDRRGRGASTRESQGPYTLAREAEDVACVVASIGDPVLCLGHSYGALVCMEALPLTDGIARALLYEPPFDTPNETIMPESADFLDTFSDLLASGDREKALELFYAEIIGVDPAPIRGLPVWQARLAAVHTLEREGRIGLQYRCDPERYASVGVPVRFLLGQLSPPAFKSAAAVAAAAFPAGELIELPGQGHVMIDDDPRGFVRHALDFFGAEEAQ
jgi:pimeloyl-ACP methyl ester carboxylesterase